MLHLLTKHDSQVLAGLANGALQQVDSGWRWSFGIAVIPAMIQLPGLLLLEESPRWLCQVGRTTEAEQTLQRIRETDSILEELLEIQNDTQQTSASSVAALRELWFTKELRRAAALGVGLQLLNQLSGINTVMYYSATIMRSYAGFNRAQAIWISLVCSLAQLTGSIGSAISMDWGRRRTMLRSMLLVICSLFVLSAAFFVLTYINDSAFGACTAALGRT